ncbi:MAG: NAD(P)-dependent oxidoreductase [Candidatus Neomarinimicrobiota bacterium]
MKILLTGGSGYLGTSLKQELRNRGNRVFSLSRSSGPHIDDLACDLTDMSEIDDIFKKLNGEKIKVVVHLASKLMDETSSQFDIFDHNLEISKGFVRLAGLLMPSKVINASSTAVYPEISGTFDEESIIMPSVNSDALYGLSKFVAENLMDASLLSTSTQCIHLRIGQVYGDQMPEDKIIPVLRKELKIDSRMTLFGCGERIIPFVNISFLIDVILKFILNKTKSGVYNVVSENMSLIDIANRIAREEGVSEPDIVLVPDGKTSKFRVVVEKLNQFLQSI